MHFQWSTCKAIAMVSLQPRGKETVWPWLLIWFGQRPHVSGQTNKLAPDGYYQGKLKIRIQQKEISFTASPFLNFRGLNLEFTFVFKDKANIAKINSTFNKTGGVDFMPAFIKSTTGPRVSRLISQSIKNDFRKFLQEISCKGKINFLNKIAKKKKPDYPFLMSPRNNRYLNFSTTLWLDFLLPGPKSCF